MTPAHAAIRKAEAIDIRVLNLLHRYAQASTAPANIEMVVAAAAPTSPSEGINRAFRAALRTRVITPSRRDILGCPHADMIVVVT